MKFRHWVTILPQKCWHIFYSLNFFIEAKRKTKISRKTVRKKNFRSFWIEKKIKSKLNQNEWFSGFTTSPSHRTGNLSPTIDATFAWWAFLLHLLISAHFARSIEENSIRLIRVKLDHSIDPYPSMLAMPRHVQLPPRYGLPDAKATLQNLDLWQQFHEIGTEMIITKSGRWVVKKLSWYFPLFDLMKK